MGDLLAAVPDSASIVCAAPENTSIVRAIDATRSSVCTATAKSGTMIAAASRGKHSGLANNQGRNRCWLNALLQCLASVGPWRARLLELAASPLIRILAETGGAAAAAIVQLANLVDALAVAGDGEAQHVEDLCDQLTVCRAHAAPSTAAERRSHYTSRRPGRGCAARSTQAATQIACEKVPGENGWIWKSHAQEDAHAGHAALLSCVAAFAGLCDPSSWIEDDFAFDELTITACAGCIHLKVPNEQTALGLHLALPPAIVGTACVRAIVDEYFAQQACAPDFTCKICERRGHVEQRRLLQTMPHALSVQLKRREPIDGPQVGGPASGGETVEVPTRKNRVRVKLCETLDLNMHVSPVTRGDGGTHLYDLVAVIEHVGESKRSGHCTAVCRSPADSRWRRFDDAQAELLAHPPWEDERVSRDAYLLYFVRRLAS